MELKSLFIGMIFAIGIFALKIGIGLHYVVRRQSSLSAKMILTFIFAVVYLMLFFICVRVVQQFNILNYYESFQSVVQSGMVIHVLMAAGFVVWGISLLKRKTKETPTYSWVAMVIPCPVCITVIFLCTAFLLAYFPNAGLLAVGSTYLIFMGIVLITAVGMTYWGITSGSSPESDMGAAMLFIAAYFFLSVIIMPQFGDLEKIYRIATYQGDKIDASMDHMMMFYTGLLILFTVGFFTMFKKVKRSF